MPARILTCAIVVASLSFADTVRGEGALAKRESVYSRAAQKNDSHRLRLSSDAKESIGNTAHPAANRSHKLLSGLTDSSATTAIAALAFVVGLFFLFAWVAKRGMPRSSRVLPTGVVRVLGRVPLAARQFGQLLHVGNKLVLVSVTQAGIEKLAEIDNAQEVDRILGLCFDGGSSQTEFNEVFGQFAKEPAAKGFLGAEVAGGRGHG